MREASPVDRLALGLWLLYYLLALGLRVGVHVRRTGRTGLVALRGRPGSLRWLAELAEVVALALGVAAAALAETVEPIPGLDGGGGHAAGVGLFALGLTAVVVSQEAMKRSWRIGIDEADATELVTTGPFALVRNPIFTGLVTVQAGLALLVPSALALAGVALLFVSVEVQARLVEEPHLLRTHGAAYESYASRVGRFVPGLGRLRPAASR